MAVAGSPLPFASGGGASRLVPHGLVLFFGVRDSLRSRLAGPSPQHASQVRHLDNLGVCGLGLLPEPFYYS